VSPPGLGRGPELEQHKLQYFRPVLEGLLKALLDNNKKVQEAGCR